MKNTFSENLFYLENFFSETLCQKIFYFWKFILENLFGKMYFGKFIFEKTGSLDFLLIYNFQVKSGRN